MAAASKIVLHHVGGRWANHPLPIPPRFADDFISVLHEADTDAIPAIRVAAGKDSGNLIVIPSCLADDDKEATLHIYPNPGFASLRRLSPMLSERYRNLFGIDYDFGADIPRVIEHRPVHCTTLDHLLAAPTPPCPPPDFLTLDVQSLEYEVLLGASEQLRQSVCGVIAEVEFGEMYEGQRRFQDVFDLLTGFGFEFVRFLTIGENGGPVAPLGFRGLGYQVWADALFLRHPRSLDLGSGSGSLTKLCFLAIIFGNVELAVACIDRLPRGEIDAHDARSYSAFVAAFADTYGRSQKLWPPAFSRVLPEHRIRDFSSSARSEQWPQIFEGLRDLGGDYLAAVEAMQHDADTDFEALLRRYEFVELADRVNSLRRDQAYHIIRAIAAASQKP